MNPNPKNKPIRLKGKKYTEFRKDLADRAGEQCETCGIPVPRLFNGYFHAYWCGHVSHIKSRGAGGSDTMDNVKWECFECHSAKHGPEWGHK